jgi:hypothetical protein
LAVVVTLLGLVLAVAFLWLVHWTFPSIFRSRKCWFCGRQVEVRTILLPEVRASRGATTQRLLGYLAIVSGNVLLVDPSAVPTEAEVLFAPRPDGVGRGAFGIGGAPSDAPAVRWLAVPTTADRGFLPLFGCFDKAGNLQSISVALEGA